MRSAVLVVVASCSILLGILIFNAFTNSNIRLTLKPCSQTDEDFIKLTPARLTRFQKALRIKTITYESGKQNFKELLELVDFIKHSYPLIHSKTENWVINKYSLLYKVSGSDGSLLPALFMSHLDVVPTVNQNWTKPHFGAEVHDDGYIYARGTIDDKNGVFGILEALEYLLQNNWKPKRTFYVAFGHDEEAHGLFGAKYIAQHLRSVLKVNRLQFVSDEGMVVLDGLIPGMQRPIATIGVSEKGYASVRLTVNATAGHSSMPPSEGAIGILAKAIARLEATPQPSQLGNGPERLLLERLAEQLEYGAAANFMGRLLLKNMWLFKPALSWLLGKLPTTNALIRTTTAITMFNSGFKQNVLPNSAVAIVNHRIHSAQTVQQVVDYDRAVIGDQRVQVEVIDELEPSPVADSDEASYSFQVVAGTVRQIFPEAIVLPGVFIAKTDTDHYLQFTHNVYRFTPNHIHTLDAKRFHGADERISLKVYEKAMNFYYHLFRNADLPPANVLPSTGRNAAEL